MKRYLKLAKPHGFINYRGNLYCQPNLVRVSADIPEDLLFIADLHLRRKHPEILDVLKKTCAGLKPGLVLLGGDIAEYSEGFETALCALNAMFPKTPMFMVPGNNDIYPEGADRIKQKLICAAYNCTLLTNECARYKGIEIAGVEDVYDHTPDSTGLFSDEPGLDRVLLAHEPLVSTLEAAEPKPDLMLSGHTHGGQLNVMGFTCYTIGYEHWLEFTHLAGVRRIGKTTCVVSRGIGISKYPLRIGAKPEIYLIGRD